jgi:hypothetical protein
MFASPTLCHFRKTEHNHGTLVGIVGFRAGMKRKMFRVCCTRHHTTAFCQPHDQLRNRIIFDASLAGLFARYAFTPIPPSYPNVRFFLQFPPPLLLQRQSTILPPGRLEYYDVAWGLTKVLLQEKGLAAISRLRRRYLVEVRNLND